MTDRRHIHPSVQWYIQARQFWVLLMFLVLLMTMAAAFYVRVESYLGRFQWTLIDGIYMAVLTVTTIGFMEVHPLSQFGRLFTTGYAIASLTILAFAVRIAAGLLVGEQLSAEWQRRRRLRGLRELQNHYIVCGYGRMGKEAVQQLRRRGLPVVVVELNPNAIERLKENEIPFIEGNATQDEYLKEAGIKDAKALIAAVGSDEDNLFCVLSARLLNFELYIVARAEQEAAIDKFMRAGANRVLSPFTIGGRQLASAVADPGVLDFLEMVLHREDLDVEIAAIPIPSHSHAFGKSLFESGIMKEGGAMILSLLDYTGNFHTNPGPEVILDRGERLIAMGSRAQLTELQQLVERRG